MRIASFPPWAFSRACWGDEDCEHMSPLSVGDHEQKIWQTGRKDVRIARKRWSSRKPQEVLEFCAASVKTNKVLSFDDTTSHPAKGNELFTSRSFFSEAASLLRGMSPSLCSLCFGRRGVEENEGPECSRALCPRGGKYHSVPYGCTLGRLFTVLIRRKSSFGRMHLYPCHSLSLRLRGSKVFCELSIIHLNHCLRKYSPSLSVVKCLRNSHLFRS